MAKNKLDAMITVRIEQEIRERVEKAATSLNMSAAAFGRLGIIQYLTRAERAIEAGMTPEQGAQLLARATLATLVEAETRLTPADREMIAEVRSMWAEMKRERDMTPPDGENG